MNAPAETGCCPRFDPALWDAKEVQWTDKLFVQDRVRSVFHLPLNFGQVIKRNMPRIDEAKALEEPALLLSDENSLWGADLYIAVTQEVPGAHLARISGTFLTKVYEGPYRDIRKWCDDMRSYVQSRERELKKLYFFYTTCPKCAKAYGKNYVVLFAQV